MISLSLVEVGATREKDSMEVVDKMTDVLWDLMGYGERM